MLRTSQHRMFRTFQHKMLQTFRHRAQQHKMIISLQHKLLWVLKKHKKCPLHRIIQTHKGHQGKHQIYLRRRKMRSK